MEINGCLIRKAEPSDQKSLKKLWQLCFYDPAAYIDSFFEKLYPYGQAWLAEGPGGEPAAMAMGLELMELRCPDRSPLPCRYLYAVATGPTFRRAGLGAALSRATASDLVLPAEESLYAYYEKLGFQDFFYVKEFSVEPGAAVQNVGNLPEPCSPEEYKRIREARLCGRIHLDFCAAAIAYQKQLGELYALCGGCAAVERGEREEVWVKELLVPEDAQKAAITGLCRLFPRKRLVIRTPADGGADCRPFGQISREMARKMPAAKGAAPYFGLAFD